MILMIVLIVSVAVIFADTVAIGTGTSTQRYPLGAYFGYERSASLYTAAELGSVNQRISSVAWYATATRTTAVPFKIYLKETTDGDFIADTWANVISGATLVYNANATVTASAWNTFTLSSTFDLTAGSNLLVLVEANYGGGGTDASSSTMKIYYTATTGFSGHETWIADTNPPTGTGTVSTSRPNITITYTIWTATLPPNPAINPNPGDTATGVGLNPTLTWSSGGGGPTSYDVYFGPSSSPASIGNQGGNSYTPAGPLAYNTPYYWKIVPRNTNGPATGCVVWSFTTMPDPTWTSPFPHSESFDGTTFPPAGWIQAQTVIVPTAYDWVRVTTGTYPSCSPQSGAGMAKYYSFLAGSGNHAILATPSITLPGNDYQVSFWMYRDGGDTSADLLNVYFNTAQNLTGTPTLLGTVNRYFASGDGWYKSTMNFPAASSGNGKYVIFEAVSAYGESIYLDDVSVQQQPSVVLPAVLDSPLNGSSGNLLTTTLNWHADTGGPTPTGYEVYFGTDGGGTTPPAALVQNSGATSYAPTLAWNTTYYWQVKPYTTGPVHAIGCPIWSFSTPPDPTIYPPYTQGFETVTVPAFPTGWTKTGSWVSVAADDVVSGLQCAKATYSPAGTSILMMPPINLPSNYRITYWWKNYDIYKVAGYDATYFEISNNGTDWTTLQTLEPVDPDATFNQVSQSLTGYSGIIYLRWRYVTDGTLNAYGVGLDDIVLEEIPAVILPALNVSPADLALDVPLNASLNWVKDTAGADPSGYNLYFGTDNPPTNIQGPKDVGLVNTWSPAVGDLVYGARYYWRIIPYDATNTEITAVCPIWQFDTMADPTIASFTYTQNFDGVTPPALPNGWTMENLNSDTVNWVTSTSYYNSSPNCMRIGYNSSLALNDWFYTPPISMVGGDLYNVSFGYLTSGSYEENLEIAVGSLPTSTSMGVPLWSGTALLNSTYVTKVVTYTAPATGNYYFGWHAFSEPDKWYICVDDIVITHPTDPILSVDKTKIILPVTPLGGGSSDALTISNVGAGTLNGTISYSAGLSGETSFSVTSSTPLIYDVVYEPTLQGLYAGTVTVTTAYGTAVVNVESNAGVEVFDFEADYPDWFVYDLDTNTDYSWGWYTGLPHSGLAATGVNTHDQLVQANEWLISPWYDVASGDKLSFYWRTCGTESDYPEQLKVLINSTGGSMEPADFTTVLHDTGSVVNFEYTGVEINLAAYVGQLVSFAFNCASADGGWYLMLDDIALPGRHVPEAPILQIGWYEQGDSLAVEVSFYGVHGATGYVLEASNGDVIGRANQPPWNDWAALYHWWQLNNSAPWESYYHFQRWVYSYDPNSPHNPGNPNYDPPKIKEFYRATAINGNTATAKSAQKHKSAALPPINDVKTRK